MDEMTAFERRIASEMRAMVGPLPRFDVDQVARTAATSSLRRRFRVPGRWDDRRSNVQITVADGLQVVKARARPGVWATTATGLASSLIVVALVSTLLLARALEGGGSVPGATGDADLPAPFGPARNGVIVASSGSALIEVDPVTGAATTRLPDPPVAGSYFVFPTFSPDGRRLLFALPPGHSWYVMDADGSALREVQPAGTYWPVLWTPDSESILAIRDGWLSIADVETGDAERFDLGMEASLIGWRPDHDQIVLKGDRDGDGIFGPYLVDADGTDLRALGPEDGINDAAVSPDGSTIAYATSEAPGPVHLLDIDTGADRELTFEGSVADESPVAFAPDGTRLLIHQTAEGPAHEEILRARGRGSVEYRELIVPLVGDGPAVVLGSEVHRALGGPGGSSLFSPDGTQVLAVYSQPPEGAWLFDATTGEGERLPGGSSWDFPTWQRLVP